MRLQYLPSDHATLCSVSPCSCISLGFSQSPPQDSFCHRCRVQQVLLLLQKKVRFLPLSIKVPARNLLGGSPMGWQNEC